MTRKRMTAVPLALAVLLGAALSPVGAQPGDKPAKPDPKATKPDPKDAAKPPADKDNAIVVTAVTGLAQRRDVSAPKATWQKVQVGDVLSNMTVIRTGLGAKVIVRLGDRSEVTIKSATKAGIRDFTKKGNLATMRLGMKYGAMSARVDATRGANDFRVSTPVATLSVRGSVGSWGFWAGKLGFHSGQSDWQGDYYNGWSRTAGAKEWLADPEKRSSDVENQKNDPGLGDPQGQTSSDKGNSDGQGGGFEPGTGTGGSLLNTTPPDVGPGTGRDTPPPIVPPGPPPAIDD